MQGSNHAHTLILLITQLIALRNIERAADVAYQVAGRFARILLCKAAEIA
jgi:phosphate uptake regulator